MNLEQLVARVNSCAYLPPQIPDEVAKLYCRKKRSGRSKRFQRIIAKVDELSKLELELLIVLLEEGWGLLRCGGEQYIYRDAGQAWQVKALRSGSTVHTVDFDLSECSCPDCRYREHECKHIAGLKEKFK